MMTGQTISHYKILEKLGEGGMGVVYKAEDLKLGRVVALKFLPTEGLNDPERKGRFLHEARAAAALDHPNICTVYEIDEVDGRLFMAMPFLDGRTLDVRIEEGPLPIEEAVAIALQLADALGEAHGKGIVHRDVKPSNVMLLERDDKPVQVKLMDFGLARLSEATRLTREGVQPGTVQYMSPEQISGEKIDHRTDIWSLGVVLYEMVAGWPPFEGVYEQALYYGIVNDPPDPLTGLRTGVPVELERVVIKCLAKPPSDRYQHAVDLGVDLRSAGAVPSTRSRLTQSVVAATPSSLSRSAPTFWKLAAAVAVLLAMLLGFWLGRRSPSDAPIVSSSSPFAARTTINLDDQPPLAFDARAAYGGIDCQLLDISPDGRFLAYVGETEGGTQLFVRDLTTFDISPVEGTEGAIHPFFAPDGRRLGFLTNDAVKTVPLDGGSATVLASVTVPVRASWANDGSIYFAEEQGWILSKTSSNGGEKQQVGARLSATDTYGAVTRDGRYAFVAHRPSSVSLDFAEIHVLDLDRNLTTSLDVHGYDPRFVESGHLLFGRSGDLFAAPIDLDQCKLVGEPQRVSSDVRMLSSGGVVQAAVSVNGFLAYAPGGDGGTGSIVWTTRKGEEEVLPLPPKAYGELALNPTGVMLAVHVPSVRDFIQIIEFGRGETLRLQGETSYGNPRWLWSGEKILFHSGDSRTGYEIRLQELNSGSEAQILYRSEEKILTDQIEPQDAHVLVWKSSNEYGTLDLKEGGVLKEHWLDDAVFLDYAPNGKWVVLTSENYEPLVRSVDGNQSYQISSGFGIEPRWCRGCDEVFFRQGNRILSSKVRFEPKFEWDEPSVAFEMEDFIDTFGWSYDVSRDGQRAIFVKRDRKLPRERIHLVSNWTTLLESPEN